MGRVFYITLGSEEKLQYSTKIGKAVSIMGGGIDGNLHFIIKNGIHLNYYFFPRGRLARSLKQPTGLFFNAPP